MVNEKPASGRLKTQYNHNQREHTNSKTKLEKNPTNNTAAPTRNANAQLTTKRLNTNTSAHQKHNQKHNRPQKAQPKAQPHPKKHNQKHNRTPQITPKAQPKARQKAQHKAQLHPTNHNQKPSRTPQSTTKSTAAPQQAQPKAQPHPNKHNQQHIAKHDQKLNTPDTATSNAHQKHNEKLSTKSTTEHHYNRRRTHEPTHTPNTRHQPTGKGQPQYSGVSETSIPPLHAVTLARKSTQQPCLFSYISADPCTYMCAALHYTNSSGSDPSPASRGLSKAVYRSTSSAPTSDARAARRCATEGVKAMWSAFVARSACVDSRNHAAK